MMPCMTWLLRFLVLVVVLVGSLVPVAFSIGIACAPIGTCVLVVRDLLWVGKGIRSAGAMLPFFFPSLWCVGFGLTWCK